MHKSFPTAKMLQKLWLVTQMDAQWFRQKKSTGGKLSGEGREDYYRNEVPVSFCQFHPKRTLMKTE